MVRKSVLYILLLSALTAAAQVTPYDRLTLGDADIMGTTRYVGLGGAMAAVGGDASAVGDNPAGLGIYRHGELMLSFDYQHNRPNPGTPVGRFSCAQASWNFCFLSDQLQGVVANNIMLNYRRVKNFSRQYGMSYTNMDYSQTDVMVEKTNGLIPTDLQGDEAWRNSDIGWLSKLGYEGYLINPDSTDNTMWLPANNGSVNGNLSVSESGAMDEFTIAWGMNISNQWYIGTELGVRSLTYMKSTVYDEAFRAGGNYSLKSNVTASGVGFISKFGLLYRPTRYLRLGAAFHSPVPVGLTLRNYADLSSVYGGTVTVGSPENTDSPRSFSQPMRVVAGMAFQLNTIGLLSLEYDYQHDINKSNVKLTDTHTAKVGMEAVAGNNWFFNLGYALRFRSLDKGKWSDTVYPLDYSSVRTDTEFANLQYAHYLSGGISFRHKYVVVGAAYQCCLKREHIRFHEMQPVPIALGTTSHRVVFSIAWRH